MLRTSLKAFHIFRTGPASRRRRSRRSWSAEALESRLMLSGATLWVDHATPSAYQTIQAAVNAAAPGSTILVAPGVYPEAVTVSTNNLTILGGQSHGRGESGPSIVETTGVAFTLEANNIQLSHFTIEPPANSTGTAGVNITAGAGDLVQNNVIESETMGIEVNTADTVAINSVTINGNTVEQSSEDAILVLFTTTVSLSGNTANNNGGGGIIVESSLGSVTAISNQANDNSVFGIFVIASSVTCHKNTANDDGTGLELAASSAMVTGNTADNDFFGFFLQTGSETISSNTANSCQDAGFNLVVGPGTITSNTADGVTTGGFSAGFFIQTTATTPKATTITGNTASGNASNGFVLLDNYAYFFENTANANGNDGILLQNVHNATINHNLTNNNKNDGIEVPSDSTDNVFSQDTAYDSGLFDFQDESTGTGTAGTGNTWTNNFFGKTSPKGL